MVTTLPQFKTFQFLEDYLEKEELINCAAANASVIVCGTSFGQIVVCDVFGNFLFKTSVTQYSPKAFPIISIALWLEEPEIVFAANNFLVKWNWSRNSFSYLGGRIAQEEEIYSVICSNSLTEQFECIYYSLNCGKIFCRSSSILSNFKDNLIFNPNHALFTNFIESKDTLIERIELMKFYKEYLLFCHGNNFYIYNEKLEKIVHKASSKSKFVDIQISESHFLLLSEKFMYTYAEIDSVLTISQKISLSKAPIGIALTNYAV